MVVKLDLKPEVQAGLRAEAQARGLSLEEYLEQVVREHAINTPSYSAEAWEKEFEAWVASFPETRPLSEEALSRESMYPDRW
jgi:hypothetical protein